MSRSVAAPIATRILERTLAMDQGTFQPQVAWIAPARKANPFQMIPAVEFKDSGPKLAASDEENLDGDTNTDMANTTADPSVEPEADAAGKVQKKAIRPVVVATPPPRKPLTREEVEGDYEQAETLANACLSSCRAMREVAGTAGTVAEQCQERAGDVRDGIPARSVEPVDDHRTLIAQDDVARMQIAVAQARPADLCRQQL